MAKFQHYLSPDIPLQERLDLAFFEAGVSNEQQDAILAFLEPIRVKDTATFDHSIRVALLARQIGDFIHLDGRALLYAGALHDVGKAQTRLSTLQKTEGWTEEDAAEIMGHVIDGYRLVRDRFDFSADIILWHHRFQPHAYPSEIPPLLHEYSRGTEILIPMYGRMLSLADSFDALHRVNDRNGANPLNGRQIKEQMISRNRDHTILVEDLFQADVFTTDIVGVW